MACGSCGGGRRQNVDYVITFKHDGSKVTVSNLSEARILRAQSPSGGTIEPVPRTAK
jgi:hypothetical protein